VKPFCVTWNKFPAAQPALAHTPVTALYIASGLFQVISFYFALFLTASRYISGQERAKLLLDAGKGLLFALLCHKISNNVGRNKRLCLKSHYTAAVLFIPYRHQQRLCVSLKYKI
jgi:hypothetical protein